MGQLLALLSSQHYEEVDLNFQGNPQPAPEDEKVYSRVGEVLSRAPAVKAIIQDYKGCQELARKAMTEPSHENELAAFEGLLEAVDSIAAFFNYCKELETVFPELLTTIAKVDFSLPVNPRAFSWCSGGAEKNQTNIPDALALQLAQVFEFALEFDRVRMLRPNLSNDFSYYRRLLPKFNKHPDIRIKDDEASGMALFTAEHIPMMNCLSKAAARAQEKNQYVGTVLSVMANSCNKALKAKKFSSDPNMTSTCVRAMTAAIVIFDHIDAQSVFHKKSPVQIKGCIQTLKRDFAKDTSLMNAIRYSTKHFSNAPQGIQDMFD